MNLVLTGELIKIDMKPYFRDLNRSVAKNVQSNVAIVRECYKAAKKVLNKLMQDQVTPFDEKNLFYQNLVQGGLVREIGDEPPSRHSYLYDVNKVELPINFSFFTSN